jgi:hypothetical protein
MPNSAARFSSEYLQKEEIRNALVALPEVLNSLLGKQRIIATYEWGSNIHGNLHHVPMNLDTERLPYFIEDSIDQRIVVPGESDVRFQVPVDRISILFCHESDIHLDGVDDGLLEQFMANAPYSLMRWYTSDEVKELMT